MKQSTASIVRWREVLALFERVLETNDATRPELLRSIASEQPELYPQLLTMLAADRSAESASFISSPPSIEANVAERDDALVGQTIGPYRVLRHIGSGGMGQVWLAERADGRYAGQVAIKLLRSFGDPLLAKRFEREGQLLARLQHPNIARLLDAGAMANGRLYLVLEYVDGDRIDRYFDAKRFTLAERIRAFLPVCDALAHAHTQLVVHRDLKPSNILVTRDGVVKLLDFGIAKLLAESNDEHATELTQVVGRAFTPDFAAPEQIRGDTVSTQTDVYALGAILYRLLAGVEPRETKTDSRASLIERTLKNESPAMSAALVSRAKGAVVQSAKGELAQSAKSEIAQTATDVAERRGVSLERLLANLKGDLDTIIGKALKIDTHERYRSVNELRDDIARYLASEPISARADNLGYRAKKFIFRHKIGVAASASLIAAIMAGVGGTLWQAGIANERSEIAEQNATRAREFEMVSRNEAARAVRGEAEAKAQALRAENAQNEAVIAAKTALANEAKAREQTAITELFRARAENEANNAKAQNELAQRETAKATSVKNFIVELFKTGDINVPDAEARELKVATTRLLNRGTERLKTQLADQPEVRSELIDTVANLHLNIESPDQAEILYREQLAMVEKTNGRDSREAAVVWTNIGKSLRNQRKYKEAEEAQLKALAIMDRIGDRASETRGKALFELVQMSFWTNTAVSNRSINVARARESIAIFERQTQPSSLSEAWQGLGRLHEAAGDNLEAANAYDRGIAATIASVGGERHAAVAGGRQMRARVLGFVGHFDEANRELLAAQKVFEDTVGVDHRFSVDIRGELAEVAHQLGDSKQAIELFRKTLAEQTKLRGETHSSVGRTRRLLAEALYDVGQLSESIAFAQDALEKSRKSTTPSRVADARLLSLLGRTYLRAGEKKRAKEALAEAERFWLDNKEAYGTGVTALDLAQLYESESEPAKATVQIEKALSLLENTRGKTRNEYWRARVAQARLAPASERVQTLEQVYANFKLEAEHVHFPRAHALILEELAAAQTLANRRADSCKTLTVAVPLRERLDNSQAASTLRLQAKKTEMCAEIAIR
jgi:eukaryotic-like serine/threonine-protein kinase